MNNLTALAKPSVCIRANTSPSRIKCSLAAAHVDLHIAVAIIDNDTLVFTNHPTSTFLSILQMSYCKST
jgi:hypothetical protein